MDSCKCTYYDKAVSDEYTYNFQIYIARYTTDEAWKQKILEAIITSKIYNFYSKLEDIKDEGESKADNQK